MPSFVPPRYFCLSPPLYFSALHDRLIFAEKPSFPRLRQDSLFLPRRFLLFRHDTFDFTAPPFFVTTRYFWFHRDAIFLMHHDTFWFARTPFAKILLTPCSAAGHFRARCLKFMPPLSRPLQHGVKKIARHYHDFILDFQYSFYFFYASAFCSFTLRTSPNF